VKLWAVATGRAVTLSGYDTRPSPRRSSSSRPMGGL
jgi:hypothetical protein